MPTDVPIAVADAIALSDAEALEWGIPRSAADTLSLSDGSSSATKLTATPADQIPFLDSINVSLAIAQPDDPEVITLSDAFTVLLDLAVSLSDTLSFSDATVASGAGILNIQISAADALAFSDGVLISDPLFSNDFINYIRRYLNDVIPH